MSVAVVGSVNLDIVARVQRIPQPGETVLAVGSSRGGGGKGANQAVAAARAGGVTTAFIGAVGADGDGSVLRAALVADGIDTTGLETLSAPTGVALISVDDRGENSIVVVPGANHALEALSAAQRRIVAAADVVAAQLEIPVPVVLEAASARRTGALFLLNAAPAEPLTAPDVAARVLPTIDVLVVNEHEACQIAHADSVDVAIEALAQRVRAVVVTLGGEGSVVAIDGTRRTVPAFRVDAVDTTGAGDTFCGVVAARLADTGLTPDSLVAAARAGAAAAALAVGRPGAQDAVPAAAEVAALLRTAT